jgi:hypothetical protein
MEPKTRVSKAYLVTGYGIELWIVTNKRQIVPNTVERLRTFTNVYANRN